MRTRILVPLASAILALFTACGDGPSRLEGPVPEGKAASKVASRLCHAFRQCGCGEVAGVALDNCGTGLEFAWQGIQEDARSNGWTYDGACLTKRLNALRDRGCETTGTMRQGCGAVSCQVFHGSVPEGGTCTGRSTASDCRQGLICVGGTCEQPCSGPTTGPLGEGETCREGTRVTGVCEEELICHPERGECVARPGEGEACVSNQCAEGLWCDTSSGQRTCRPTQPAGTDCTTPLECMSRACEEGTCAATPEEGEPCATGTGRSCAGGLACVDATCVQPPGEGEACLDSASTPTTQCAGELVCSGRLCSTHPDAPGCDSCTEPPGECLVRVCAPEPPAVCVDSGGLLF